jgi:hypothetical protein
MKAYSAADEAGAIFTLGVWERGKTADKRAKYAAAVSLFPASEEAGALGGDEL